MTDIAETLLSAIPMPLVLIGPDERIRSMNPSAANLFSEAGQKRHFVTVLRQPALLEAVEHALEAGTPGTVRYSGTTLAGEASFRVYVAPLEDKNGRSVLLSFEDVTDLERAGEMRRDFVANVSHELKTPLTALVGFIETLRGAARDDPAARERFLAIMDGEAARMNRLVSDLLSLSRVESVERQRPTDVVDIAELVNAILVSLGTVAEAEQVQLVAERLDGSELPLRVRGDRDQLQQVLVNLIENGIKYGRRGGKVRVCMTYSARELAFRGPGVQVDVIDNGEGFDPIHIPRLTERFYRVDNHRSREMGGTGLGLAIAKHIVNRHRGRLRIETEPGQGARFTVLLPALEQPGS